MPLNEQQEVVAGASGALAVKVVAGAGTGKTETLAARFVELVRGGIAPSQIVLLTFTEDAAAEMRERVRLRLAASQLALPPHELIDLWCHTFHGFAMRLIRQWGWAAGLPPAPGRLDEPERQDLLQQIVDAWEEDFERSAYRPLDHTSYRWDNGEAWAKARAVMDRLRASGATPGELGPHPQLEQQQQRLFAGERAQLEPLVAHLYETYGGHLRRAGVLDYDEQIGAATRLLALRPDLSRQFAVVMVDEFQDTNPAQLELLAWLRPDWSSVTVVGDPRQAIYGWRSARPDSLRQFPYDSQRTYLSQPLSQNYRSRPAICAVANLSLLRTELAWEEPLVAARAAEEHDPVLGAAPEVSLHLLPDLQGEALFVAAEIEHLIASGVHASEIALLMRARTHLPTFTAALREAGVPYVVGGGSGFFHRPVVRLVASLLQFLVDPDDNFAATHLLESPLVGLDPRLLCWPSVDQSVQAGRSAAGWLVGSVGVPDDLPMRAAVLDRLGAFRTLYRIARARMLLFSPGSFLTWLFSAAGLRGWAHDAGDEQALRDLDKLIELADQWGAMRPELSIGAYAERLGRAVAEQPDEPIPHAPALDAVEVSTIHGAKGREWKVVCVVDTSLPSQRSGQVEHVLWDEVWKLVISDGRAAARGDAPDPLADLRRDLRRRARNEERSIWYVALTRARDRLIVTHSGCDVDAHAHFPDARTDLSAEYAAGDDGVHFFHELWEQIRLEQERLGGAVFWGPGPCLPKQGTDALRAED